MFGKLTVFTTHVAWFPEEFRRGISCTYSMPGHLFTGAVMKTQAKDTKRIVHGTDDSLTPEVPSRRMSKPETLTFEPAIAIPQAKEMTARFASFYDSILFLYLRTADAENRPFAKPRYLSLRPWTPQGPKEK
jgi:hypothetical protein